ncbi:MAG: ribosomal protein S18-alanine N-acetyltransferase [Magnetococcales bacterium]|nr:ribosomal protein S18-alanine N-acetyltransferase [Magnetococcales bacterium]
MNIRPMRATDIPQVAALEAAITPTPWSPGLFAEELTLGSHCRILAGKSGEVLGYCVARLLVDEWHLLTLGIAPACRRQGWARRLVQDLLQQATRTESVAILLEVRASNVPARTLYQDMGFTFLYTRKGYYRLASGTEDAILFALPLAKRP